MKKTRVLRDKVYEYFVSQANLMIQTHYSTPYSVILLKCTVRRDLLFVEFTSIILSNGGANSFQVLMVELDSTL